MTTARQLYHRCRRAGIVLEIDGDEITFDAPLDVVVPVEELRRCKDELLCILAGDYKAAAAALLLLVGGDAIDCPALLAEAFDDRARICVQGGMNQGEAERVAYVELARRVEGGVPSPSGGFQAPTSVICSGQPALTDIPLPAISPEMEY